MAVQQEQHLLSSIIELARCSLCSHREISSTPKVLPCFHSACEGCLGRVLINVTCEDEFQRPQFQCPVCKKEHCVPGEGIHDLIDNSFSLNMKFLSGIISNNPPKCNACRMIGEDTPSSTYCLQCQGHLCQTDGSKHMSTPGHQVVAHTDLSSDRIIQKLLAAQSGRCEDYDIHEDPQQFKHYCIECETLSCGECLTYKHDGHSKMPLKKAGEMSNTALKEMVTPIEEKREEKRKYLADLHDRLSGITQSKSTAAKKIADYGKKVKELVDTLVRKELEDLEKNTSAEEKSVKKEIEEVSFEEKQLDVVIEHINTFLNYGSPVNILQKEAIYKEYLETCFDEIKDLDPMKGRTFSFFHVNEDAMYNKLKDMILGHELPLLHVPLYDEVVLSVNQESHETIALTWDDALQVRGGDGKEKKLVEFLDLQAPPGIATHGNLTYLAVAGEDEVVALNGEGCVEKFINLPLTETIEKTNEQKENESAALDVAGEDEVVALNGEGCVEKFINLPFTVTIEKTNEQKENESTALDNDNFLLSYETPVNSSTERVSGFEKNWLHYLAIDSGNGDLYISTTTTNSIYKCTPTETEAKPFLTKDLHCPFFMCVIPNKGLAVSNMKSRLVHFYSFDGTLLWEYSNCSYNPTELSGICADHLGNLFVADPDKQQLHYLSSDGELLRLIDFKREGTNFFPRYVTMMNNKLFVTDCAGTVVLTCNYTGQQEFGIPI